MMSVNHLMRPVRESMPMLAATESPAAAMEPGVKARERATAEMISIDWTGRGMPKLML